MVDMIMPQMGESIAEATISKWLKNVGDVVKKDEIILEISTDKVDSEIPAPESGVLTEILFTEGDVVPVKEKIAVIDSNGAGATAAPAQPAAQAAPQATPEPAAPAQAVPAAPQASNGSTSSSSRFYSPLVKSLAEKHGVNLQQLDQVPGTGQGGRFTKQDFMSFIEGSPSAATTTAAPQQPTPQVQTPAPAPAPAAKPDMPGTGWQDNNTKIVPMDNMRRAIAEHMVRSKATSPHVYSVQEVDVTKISAWRKRYKAEFKEKEGFNLSFTPFFLEAAVKALVEFPIVNSSIDGNSIIMKKHVNLGCAVALGNTGLIVPVIKQAEERNLVGLARALNDLATRARNKKLMPDDVMDGSFTVTNPGVFGTIIGTPIINQPQVAILCLGAIEKRPVVVDDMIAIRERCYLTLSYDHRIVDGAMGGQYLAFVTNYLESWDSDRPLY